MPRRGQQHHNATLSDDQVKAMRVIYKGWKERKLRRGYRHMAKLFNCGVSTARDILTYRTRYNV